MAKVSVHITNTPAGLHNGHKAVIEFGKQFGDVTVNVIENFADTVTYLRTGISTGKYRLHLEAMQQACEEMNVTLRAPTFIEVPEDARQEAANKAMSLIQVFRPYLLSTAYDATLLYNLMLAKLGLLTSNADYIVNGPEIPFLLLKKLAPLLGRTRREIYPQIVYNEYGLKYSSSAVNVDRSILERLRPVIQTMKPFYKPGKNEDLIREINDAYPPTVGWRVAEINVYENWPTRGRLEATYFKVQTDQGYRSVENVDYYD